MQEKNKTFLENKLKFMHKDLFQNWEKFFI